MLMVYISLLVTVVVGDILTGGAKITLKSCWS